jgi:hypothetical protein
MEAMRVIKMERSGSQMQANDVSPEMAAELPQLAIIGGFRKFSQ